MYYRMKSLNKQITFYKLKSGKKDFVDKRSKASPHFFKSSDDSNINSTDFGYLNEISHKKKKRINNQLILASGLYTISTKCFHF